MRQGGNRLSYATNVRTPSSNWLLNYKFISTSHGMSYRQARDPMIRRPSTRRRPLLAHRINWRPHNLSSSNRASGQRGAVDVGMTLGAQHTPVQHGFRIGPQGRQLRRQQRGASLCTLLSDIKHAVLSFSLLTPALHRRRHAYGRVDLHQSALIILKNRC